MNEWLCNQEAIWTFICFEVCQSECKGRALRQLVLCKHQIFLIVEDFVKFLDMQPGGRMLIAQLLISTDAQYFGSGFPQKTFQSKLTWFIFKSSLPCCEKSQTNYNQFPHLSQNINDSFKSDNTSSEPKQSQMNALNVGFISQVKTQTQ